MNISLPEIVREEAAARRAAERMVRRPGHVPLAPQLGIVAYRDDRGVSLSAGILTAGQVMPPA